MNVSKRTLIPALLLAAGALYAAARPAPGGEDVARGGDPGARAELRRAPSTPGDGTFQVLEEIDRAQTAIEPDPDLANGFDQITGRPYGVQWRRQKE